MGQGPQPLPQKELRLRERRELQKSLFLPEQERVLSRARQGNECLLLAELARRQVRRKMIATWRW